MKRVFLVLPLLCPAVLSAADTHGVQISDDLFARILQRLAVMESRPDASENQPSPTARRVPEPEPEPESIPGEREAAPADAVRVTTVSELVAARNRLIAAGGTGHVAIAVGLYDIRGTDFMMDYSVSYSGGWDAATWTRPKARPSTEATVDPETGEVTFPERLRRFLDDPSASGETIFTNDLLHSLEIGGNVFPRAKMVGSLETVIDRIAVVGTKNEARTQPTCLFVANGSKRLLRDIMTVDRHTGGHCYIGASGWQGDPVRMSGCIVSMPYGGGTGNPRPQAIFYRGNNLPTDTVIDVQDCLFIGPVQGGSYTRLPNLWNYVQDAHFQRCQFIGGSNSRMQSVGTATSRFTDCEFHLATMADVLQQPLVMQNCRVWTGGAAKNVTSPAIDLGGTTFYCPEGVDPFPDVAGKGGTIVRQRWVRTLTAPLFEGAEFTPLAALAAAYPKLAEIP